MFSTSSDRRSENVLIHAVVIPELKLRDAEWEIFRADFVEFPKHAAFNERLEALNRVRMNRADDVLALGIVNHSMRIFAVEVFVADQNIRIEVQL